MLLNLVSALNTDDRDVVWDYVCRYNPRASEDKEVLDLLIDRAMSYYADFVLPHKVYALPPEDFRPAVDALLGWLDGYDGNDSKEIQNAAYAIGKEHEVDLRTFFSVMYQLILGEERGPRLGTFISLYGAKETLALAREKLAALTPA